jgi:hypothetical protein
VTEAKTYFERLIQELRSLSGEIDWAHHARVNPDPQVLVEEVLASLPTIHLVNPPVGACYGTRGLAQWRGVSRQAVLHQRKEQSILGFLYHGAFVYPAIQFGPDGRPLPVIRQLLAAATVPLTEAAEVAAWLQTPDPSSGLMPVEVLAVKSTTAGWRPSRSQLTFVTPETFVGRREGIAGE